MTDSEFIQMKVQDGEDRGLLWGLLLGLVVGAGGVAALWVVWSL